MRYKIEVILGQFFIKDTGNNKHIYMTETPENAQQIIDIMNFEEKNPWKIYSKDSEVNKNELS